MSTGDTSFLGLNRPEYVSAPELLVSELAWSLVATDTRRELVGKTGLAFGTRETSRTGTTSLPIELTGPDTRSGELVEFMRDLLECSPTEAQRAATLLASEIENFASGGSKRSTAVPLTPGLALMSNSIGVLGKRNPANIAGILEQMNALGGGTHNVAHQWFSAFSEAGGKGLPGWMVEAEQGLLHDTAKAALEGIHQSPTTAGTLSVRRPSWLNQTGVNSPFSWFSASWRALCGEDWISRMPRRRWADWTTSVTRTALAFSFLFEMHITRRMISGLFSSVEPRDVVRGALADARRLLTWDDRLKPSSADVGPMIRDLSNKGSACQDLLGRLVQADEDFPRPAGFDEDPNGLVEWLRAARARLEAGPDRSGLENLMAEVVGGKPPASAKNVRETIQYSLGARAGLDKADLYRFAVRRGRYFCVDPGQEWIVVVASLAAGRPGATARMHELESALRRLGINAAGTTLVRRLETYGLCLSSHDADAALEIQPAF